ncbi:hypothetical protein FHEFKHOI_00274 [Candidatus Methanoperedenaceae archaeon GB50]|nr:hypothetical protein AIOGIFDO_00270 [Candidatus Methanoperedenaceae archaeon GB37]CAD7768460.1 hypothetical protein FHEFKHOI_00274 [Candidatus Methanoperedenaceae archaeon GB50]
MRGRVYKVKNFRTTQWTGPVFVAKIIIGVSNPQILPLIFHLSPSAF